MKVTQSDADVVLALSYFPHFSWKVLVSSLASRASSYPAASSFHKGIAK